MQLSGGSIPKEAKVVDSGLVVLKYDGGDAERNNVDLGQFAKSLAGWNEVFRITSEEFVMRGAAMRPLAGLHASTRVLPLRPGSVETVVELLFWGILTNAVWDGMKFFGKRFVPTLSRVVSTMRECKSDDLSIRETAERYRALAEYVSNDELLPGVVYEQRELLPNPSASAERQSQEERAIERELHIVADLDEALRSAVAPAGKSVESIQVSAPAHGEIAMLTNAERELFGTAFRTEQVPPDQVMLRRRIKFLGINKKNGWGRFEFADNPDDATEMNQQDCKITDRSLKGRKDQYTKHLYEGTPLDVWVEKKTRQSSTHYWEIKGIDEIGPSLFDRKL